MPSTAVSEVDRHAKVVPKEGVCAIRPIEFKVGRRSGGEDGVIRGDCSAVRSAPIDDGHFGKGLVAKAGMGRDLREAFGRVQRAAILVRETG